ncbi:MAG: thiamine pyrophosphate-dependent enzyme [Bacteroides sp.]|jgi:pyruvate/2-oxoglutarate/acetoin dehydrogenase E1 component/TPP-dependent pyruvate/acetoin dehydrogenase alpha subunit|nr:thiamine pyrophosphate-dependent enzyme [Bacteroides sp.]
MAAKKKEQPEAFVNEVLNDYRIANESRQASLLGRREVLTGKAKFGIFGDGKEVPQLAMAKAFKDGDWRSGYYRDQTFMLATGMMSLETFFSQLYGDTDLSANPDNGGRMMNNHFASRSLDAEGNWKDLTKQKNSSADISPTAGQMPRLLGLAQASKIYRNESGLKDFKKFSNKGNEVAFGTIGDASTSEGHFWETINAAAVLQVPLAMSVWDDGFGISVPKEFQTAKSSISEALSGMEIKKKGERGIHIFREKAWNYEGLIKTYEEGVALSRKEHVPVLFHITEVTQPQGHSTSGSHERYKSKERLEWEKEYDCIRQMRLWILEKGIANEEQLNEIEKQAVARVKEARKNAWDNFQKPILLMRKDFIELVNIANCNCRKSEKIDTLIQELSRIGEPIRKDIISTAKKILRLICHNCASEKSLKHQVMLWLDQAVNDNIDRYGSHLYSETGLSPLKVKEVPPEYADDAPMVNGREILVANFDSIFAHYPESLIFGEDVGNIGGVNQTLEGLQKKYGELRIADTGIREATIIGQGLGMAMRGLRPIAEIQYFDYLLYGLQVLSDDLATLRYRTVGGQKAPLIISTRGHRLEGIWHSGSPMSMVVNAVRGINVLVPRDMTRAAGFYNTLMQCDDPGIVIEPLNGYRLKEKLPANIGDFTLPLGKPEILNEGTDVTLVTYGSCVRIAEDAIEQLKDYDISVELVDVQSMVPFDIHHSIVESLKKTNKIIFFDEDLPGGATAYMMQKVLEEQGGYLYLDAEPGTITAREHRAAYSTDGDYFSNPNAEDVFEKIYNMMNEYNPEKYPQIF